MKGVGAGAGGWVGEEEGGRVEGWSLSVWSYKYIGNTNNFRCHEAYNIFLLHMKSLVKEILKSVCYSLNQDDYHDKLINFEKNLQHK